MNIYDFDNTIFKGDSSVKFITYSFFRHPLLLTISLIKGLKEIIKSIFRKSDLGKIKSAIFSFVKYLDNLDDYIEKYILKHQKNIKKFYLDKKKCYCYKI